MTSFTTTPGARCACLAAGATTLVALVALALLVVLTGTAAAAATLVPLGTASSFAVLAGSTVTNTGPSIVSGDLGVSPRTAVTGFPPGTVLNGTIHAADPVAAQAEADLTTAYNDAAGQTPATVLANTDLGGQTLVGGIYKSAAALSLTGTVTLDGQNNPASVFVIQAGSTLVTASNSTVLLIDGANACNVFWQVGSSATLGTSTTFVGSILALTSITVQTTTTVSGRVLARDGQVSLDTNTIIRPDCTTPPTTTAAPTTTTAPPTTTTVPPTTTTAPSTTTTRGGGHSSAVDHNGSGTHASTGTQVRKVPVGSVDTGDGSTEQGTGFGYSLLAAALALTGAVVGLTRRLRRDS